MHRWLDRFPIRGGHLQLERTCGVASQLRDAGAPFVIETVAELSDFLKPVAAADTPPSRPVTVAS